METIPRITHSLSGLYSLATCVPTKGSKLPLGLYNTLKNFKLLKSPPTRRGTTAGRNVQRNIAVVSTPDRPSLPCLSGSHKPNGVNFANLIKIKTVNLDLAPSTPSYIDCCLLNTRSVGNKAAVVRDYVIEHDIDVLCITETWLKPGDSDAPKIGELTPEGFKLPHEPREKKKGGGVGILHRCNCDVKTKDTKKFISFEHMEVVVKDASCCVRLVVLYRPPPSKGNKLTVNMFYDDFGSCMEHLVVSPGKLIVLGDFNFHMDIANEINTRKFNEILSAFNLKQHVIGRTHKDGHTLDLIITRSDDDIVCDIDIGEPQIISDHSAIHFHLKLKKPGFVRKQIQYRKVKAINMDSFKMDIQQSDLVQNPAKIALELSVQYNKVLQEILDHHAPLRKAVITIRPSSDWYTEEIREAKQERRRLERHWKASGLTIDKLIFSDQCNQVIRLINETKESYYNNIISENASNQKVLNKIVEKLLNKKSETPLPIHSSLRELAERFVEYFSDKILKIREDIFTQRAHTPPVPEKYPTDVPILSEFKQVTEEEVKRHIKDSASKHCDLDPVPTWLLKQCLDVLLPVITLIVNLSLSESVMPENFKEALLLPLLKKANMDYEIFKHFRPISNLAYISKIIEKVVASQTMDHIYVNNLHEIFQSAYKRNHSTETALLRVHNDILQAIDQDQAVALILLDLSAAFDTVDHEILLKRLSGRLGIRGAALAWFRCYLSGRTQKVTLNGTTSSGRPLPCGVPQGSVLGPILFTIYSLPLGDIARKHGIPFQIYADDEQLYIVFKPKKVDSIMECKMKMETCIVDICSWYVENMLKCNETKTEFIILSSRWSPDVDFPPMRIGTADIAPTTSVRNLGVIFDSGMSLHDHVAKVVQCCFIELRKLAMIRKHLNKEAAQTVVHAYVTSRLDYCNSLLYGLPQYEIQKLQYVQNSAARLITGLRKYDHITQTLHSLHWLPVHKRIIFKMLLITYKALNGLAPAYITELLNRLDHVSGLRSMDDALLLKVPLAKKVNYGERAYARAAPLLWNELPLAIRDSPSPQVFKSSVKTLLFLQHFSDHESTI